MTDEQAPPPPAVPADPPPPDARTRIRLDTPLADGEWHRLHPATPLLRGGLFLIALLGYVISQARQQLAELFIGGHHKDEGDPITFVTSDGRLPIALGVIAIVLILLIGIFYLSWRVHEFRITDELVEVKQGVLRRTERKGRLDRIQGVNIVRPFFARFFGAARLEIDVAGHDANVRLDYLSSANADALRRDILRLASGVRAREQAEAAAGMPPGFDKLNQQLQPAQQVQRGFIEQRVSDFTAPELDPSIAAAESVVKIHTGRLLGSLILHDTTLTFVIVLVAAGVASSINGQPFAFVIILPFLFGIASFLFRRFTKSLRYSIAATPDGVRVGFGILTLSNETLPPGRIHSIQVRQPVLWRIFGWWEIKVNRASKSNAKGADGQRNTTILPVGNRDDVQRVLGLLLPGLAAEDAAETLRLGLTGTKGAGGYTTSPLRAAWVRVLSWRRNGYARLPGIILLREGAIWRRFTIVPEARVQSLGLTQGPLYRLLRLAHLHIHTVNGPIRAELGAVDRDVALAFFSDVSISVTHSVGSDTTHRWRSGEAST
ncbi:MAG TPA: PH domain-containing protein [Galbitalea sp.]